jgi:signal transduction histidine kinase
METITSMLTIQRVFEVLFDNLEEGIVVVDEEDMIILANAKAVALLKINSDSTNKTFTDLWEGRSFSATLRSHPLDNGSGGESINIFREWKEREVDRARTELLSLAAHQLRTPLTAVKLFTDMLLAKEYVAPDDRELLRNIERSNEKMIGQIEHFLSLSGTPQDRLKMRRVPIDPVRFLERIVDDARAFADLKGSTIVLSCTRTNTAPVDIDPHLLREVIDNVLTNALTYSPPRSTVEVSLERGERSVITISDAGIGIPEEVQSLIFTKNYRAPNARDVHQDGNGLGLYMCDIIMESLGGNIWFESQAGKGTRFYISFP